MVKKVDAVAREVTQKILDLVGIKGSITIADEDDHLMVEVESPEAPRLIGKDGATLEAFQHLVVQVIMRKMEATDVPRIHLDVAGYRRGRLEEVALKARHTAHSVLESGRSIVLPPMTAVERRAVHMAVQAFGTLQTESIGTGSARRVVIKPKKEEEKAEE